MRRLSLALPTLTLLACGGEPADPGDPGPGPGDPEVTAVVLAPADTSLYVGRSFQSRAMVTTASGDDFSGDHVEYTAVDAAVNVSAAGVVTGNAIGRARVVARRGTLSDTIWVSVVPEGTIAYNYNRALVAGGLDGSVFWAVPSGNAISGPTTWVADGQVVVERDDPQLPALLYLAHPDGTVRTLFPWSPGEEPPSQTLPRASRDGQWVYFLSEESLWRAHADGTGRERLVGNELPVVYDAPDPSWDGTRVLFTRADGLGTTTQAVLDLETREQREIPGLGSTSRWSPDGQWIAYWKGSDGDDRAAVYIARSDGSQQRRVTAEGVRYYSEVVEWSPDGRWLLLNRATGHELVEIATGMRLPLTWATGSWASWRP